MSDNIIKLNMEEVEKAGAPKTDFGKLMDSSEEDFKAHCADKSVGYVSSLRNYIAGAYQTLVKMKDDLKEKIKTEGLSEDSEEMMTIKGIYANLIKLEQKATICAEICKERALKD